MRPAYLGTLGSRMNTLVVVAVALLRDDGHVLIAERAAEQKWEFPGGKVEVDESCQEGLAREMKEELDVTVQPSDLVPFRFVDCTRPSQKPNKRPQAMNLIMLLYTCRRWRGEPRGNEGQRVRWVSEEELPRVELMEADEPLIEPMQGVMRSIVGAAATP